MTGNLMHPVWALQMAVFSTLQAAKGLMAIMGADHIHDAPPRSAEFPYIVFNTASILDWGHSLGEGRDVRLTIHCWSRYQGKKEVLAMMAAIKDAIERVPSSNEGWHFVLIHIEQEEVRRERDHVTWHGVQNLHALMEAIPSLTS